MEQNNKLFEGYNTGAEFWRDNALKYGNDEAAIICGNYLDMSLKRRCLDSEKRFCREMFEAMYEAMAVKTDATKLVYPYGFSAANERLETSYFQKSRNMNNECARAIDTLIGASQYETNFYNLELAAIKAIMDYGFSRVSRVLAFNIQRHESDGRLSSANKQWAKEFLLPDKTFDTAWLRSHMTLVEDFCRYVRKLCTNFNFEWLELPGKVEGGEYVHGYEITRAIMVDENQGYALAHNPDAVDPYVCWQFYIRDGERSYNWGHYANNEQTVVDNYIARVYVALN